MLGFMGTLPSIPMGKVTKSYLVCATPRSGSTLLCALLEGTGVAGKPEESFERLWRTGLPRQPREYFDDVDDPGVLDLLAPTDPGAADRSDPFPPALERGTTPNGVFAAKLMWTHLLDLAERSERPADPTLLEERLPELRYVHVTRADKVAQAVSLWRAVQTRAWRAGDVKEEGVAVYHGGAIAHLVAQLTEQDEAWRAWFAANDIEPLTIAYEALAEDATAAVESVLAHVGAGPAEIPEPPMRRQGDDRSARWVEHFRGGHAPVR
jgi:trehalose 2-sulfotransferase